MEAENNNDAYASGDCGVCGETREYDMVQCDLCDAWFHYECVDVTNEIANTDWSCKSCRTDQSKKQVPPQENNGKIDAPSTSHPCGQQLPDQAERPRISEVSRVEFANGKHKGIDLEYELRFLEEQKQIELNYMRKKAELMRKCEKVTNKCRQDNLCTVDRVSAQNKNTINRSDAVVGLNFSKESNHNLRTEQINARHAVPKELPIFTGKPEEWPAFISSYENSTRLCGYSHDENLLRLQHALKGQARETVSSQLLIPALVPEVISTLRMMFGRPERIINSLLIKIRGTANVSPHKLDNLISFSVEVKNLVATMVASDLQSHLENPLLLSELIEKLPTQLRLEWAMFSRQKFVNLTHFSEWLFELATAASSVVSYGSTAPREEKKKQQRVNFHEQANNEDNNVSNKGENTNKCVICSKNHLVKECDKFRQLPYKEKWDTIRSNRLCRTCLKMHDLARCRERKECGLEACTAKHHPLLHKPIQRIVESNNVEQQVAIQVSKTSKILFKILPITIYGNNCSVDIFALLDDGSGPTMIEKNIISKLNLKGKKTELCVRWTDGSVRTEPNSELLDFNISARGKNNKQIYLRNVHTVENLDLPSQTMNVDELTDRFSHLKGLPVQSYANVIPNMIIGLNNKHATLPTKFREGKVNEPAATKTRIGWTIFGALEKQCERFSENMLQLHVCQCDDEIALNKLMIENSKIDGSRMENHEQELCMSEMEMYENKVERTGNSFTAKLFWRSNDIVLPDNFSMALKRLECFERKLNKNPELKSRVNTLIKGMEQKQYVRKLTTTEIDQDYPRKWYLPIFSVHNPNKPNKTRIVWDAAAEYEGISLNKCLEPGPNLLYPLIDVLYNFRKGKIGICGDICEMFHRVNIHDSDQHSQRFLWRDCQSNISPHVYVLQVCSFGATCSPYIAQCAKNKNAREHAEIYPRAVKSILKHHYMDDMLDSVDTLSEAVDLVEKVSLVHSRGNFEIRNWLSNSLALMQIVKGSQKENNFCRAAKTIDHVIEPDKVLGLWWHTQTDTFVFNTKFTKASAEILNGLKLPTKRELLRLLMSIFDPLGFLSFYTVRVKILLQAIWRSGIEWDDVIPKEFENTWQEWLSMFGNIGSVQIPRCYFGKLGSTDSDIDLHVFVDASSEAYAAVAYLRIVRREEVKVVLVGSKTKVAPIRPLSIPRMELLGALLGARFAKSIKDSHEIKVNTVNFWTDSKTILFWLRESPRKYKQFVMFRIAEIQEITEVSRWFYVPTKMNVADKATKINTSIKFDSSSEWFLGPSFLKLSESEWPPQYERKVYDENKNQENSELEKQLVGLQVEIPSSLIDSRRFSKWEFLWHSMAYIKHFFNNLKIKLNNKKMGLNFPIHSSLTTEELRWAENVLYSITQRDQYFTEINIMKENPNSTVHKSSPLRKLSPYLDNESILRVRGRIDNAPVGFDTKNPIILPKNHRVTMLIVDWYHRKYRHIHNETVLNEINKKFYIAGLRRVLRSIRSACQICKNNSAMPVAPEMGMLPEARLSAFTRPFAHTGIDFFGPFVVCVGRRKDKRYGVMFTCLTCRAVHIEVAYSLSMNSCIMAIRNFIGRRGVPQHLYSDNGTNFVAAEKELREAYRQIDFQGIQEEFTTSVIKWSFIPPASPHMGGAWERMIRSAKNVLYKIVTPTTHLNDEKLLNLLIEVESILNSRPLTYVSLDTTDQEALTPNHFLLGSSDGNKPPGKFDISDQYVKSSWRHSQYLAECFWKRWLSEVLPLLTRRSKWYDKVKPIATGDVVLVVDPNLPRYTWPKGIVANTVLAKDGQVRSVYVRSKGSLYHRPASKIAVLDVLPNKAVDGLSEVDDKGMDSNNRHTGGRNVGNSRRDE